jgi:hypothetical protein
MKTNVNRRRLTRAGKESYNKAKRSLKTWLTRKKGKKAKTRLKAIGKNGCSGSEKMANAT